MYGNNEEDLLQDLITKSEVEFEKKILYIGAGALLLSLTLIDKVISLEGSEDVGFLVTGWCCLVLTLLINLLSHLISKIHLRKAVKEIQDKIDITTRQKSHRKRLIIIESINWISVVCLIVGVSMVVAFASLNAI